MGCWNVHQHWSDGGFAKCRRINASPFSNPIYRFWRVRLMQCFRKEKEKKKRRNDDWLEPLTRMQRQRSEEAPRGGHLLWSWWWYYDWKWTHSMFVNRPLFRCRGSLSPVHRVQKKKRKRRPPPVSLMTCKRNTAGTWQEVILGEETWNSVVLLSVFYLSFRFPEPPRLVPTHCDWARIYSFQSVVVGDQKRQQNASERKERKEKRLRCRFTDTAPVAAFCYGIGRSPSVLMVDVTFIMDPILAHTHTHTHTTNGRRWPLANTPVPD